MTFYSVTVCSLSHGLPTGRWKRLALGATCGCNGTDVGSGSA